jgi:patatin-like phospholipase/acyl hydrolase
MKTILSIDGGGIRGLIPLEILKTFPQTPDLIAGTSTGGMIAVMLSLGISPEEISRIYIAEAKRIFHKPWWRTGWFFKTEYDGKGLRDVVEGVLGGKKLKDLKIPTIIPAFRVSGPKKNTLKVFKSWTDREESLVDVVLATSAAPKYFPRYKDYVDGGLAANNPAGCALADASRLWPSEKFKIISLGTGVKTENFEVSGGALEIAPKIIDMVMDASASAVDYQCFCHPNARYHRIQPKLRGKDWPMDSYSPKYLKKLQDLGKSVTKLDKVITICQKTS